MKYKLIVLISILSILISYSALAYEQSHPLSQIHPIDVNLDMFAHNITNVSYLVIGGTIAEYPLDIYGSGRFTGDLYVGGTIYGNLHGSITLTGNLDMNGYSIINANWVNATYLNVSNNVYIGGKVGIGTNTPVEKLDVNGAIKIGDTGSACDADHRGVIKFVQGSSGEDDKLYMCMKNSTDSYVWVLVARGG